MSSWFFSISLSSPCWEERAEGVGRFSADGSQSSRDVCCGKAGAKNGQHHVGPHRGEREAKRDRDPIQGWSPSSSAEPGLQARIRRSAKLSTIMPSFVRGGGPRRQVQIFATALKPEPGAAHCHLGAVRKRRWSLSSSSRLFWRFVRHCGRSQRGASLQRAASRAPMGISPVSARRHSAITSLRMSATIRTFFTRPLAPPRRALNHCASALSG